MIRLYILRHGKSSYDTDKDFDRGLTDRGKNDARVLGEFLKERGERPEFWFSSSAKRANKTAKLVNEASGFDADIHKSKKLYLASAGEIIEQILKLDIQSKSIIVIGHNPGLTALVNFFGVNLDNLPTCGLVCFEFDVENVQDIDGYNAEFKFAHFPKKGLIV